MGKIKASHAMMEVFKHWGIKRVYGLPGDSIDTTVDALQAYKDDIEFIQVRHEEVAGMAAAYEAELTGEIAVCLSIGGPGAIHMLNGLYDAKMNEVPVLALVGQVQSELINTHFFQEVNTKEMCEDVAVFNRLIQAADTLPEVVDEAIRTAITKKGVAVLTIPDDIPDRDIDEPILNVVGREALMEKPQINKDKIEELAKMIKEAKKPLVLSGKGAHDARQELAYFVTLNHLPIIQTVPSKGNVADNHPNSLGNVGKLGTKPAYEAMKETDLLIMIGTNYPFVPYLPEKGQAKIVQIDVNPNRFGKRLPLDMAIHGDVKDVLSALNHLGNIHPSTAFLQSCQENMANWNRWMDEERSRKDEYIHPAHLVQEIEKIADSDAIFSIDVGTSTAWAARFLRVQPTQEFLLSTWLGTMGCGLPGAIAAKAVHPKRQVISLCGDGAFSMVMQDFVTAVKYKMPMLVFVLNNQKLSFIQYEQQSAGQLNYEIDLHDIDHAKVAEACGGIGYTVHTPEELEELMPTLANVTEPTLIDVYVADDAPLPGKIVWDEAKGYAEFVVRSIIENREIPDMPPLKDVIRKFF